MTSNLPVRVADRLAGFALALLVTVAMLGSVQLLAAAPAPAAVVASCSVAHV